jgi:hypothetical protein
LKGIRVNLEFRVITFDVVVVVKLAPDLWPEVEALLGVGQLHLVQEREVVLLPETF